MPTWPKMVQNVKSEKYPRLQQGILSIWVENHENHEILENPTPGPSKTWLKPCTEQGFPGIANPGPRFQKKLRKS